MMSYIIRLSLSVASVLLVACVSNTRFEGVPPDEARVEIEAAGTESLHYERPLIIVAANTLLKYGVRVFAYPGMSHIKAVIYDGWACAGSANFDKLSFQVNKEMNLGSSDPAFVRDLIDKVFDPDFATAAELKEPLPSGWKNTFASIIASQL